MSKKGKIASSSSANVSLVGTFVSSPFELLGTTETQMDAEFQLGFKALSKKDSITKLKALQELGTLFKGLTDENLQVVLKHWVHIYPKIIIDNDRRVREATNDCFLSLIRSVKKHLAPYLKQLMGPWLTSLFDPSKEVCIAAQNAFSAAIPSKQVEALVFCKKEILLFIIDNLNQTVQSLSDEKSVPSEVAQERYERVISSTIYSLGYIIERFPTEENDNLMTQYSELLDQKFWKFLSSKNYPLIRKASYKLVSILSSKLKNFVETNLQVLTPSILGIFSDIDPSTHSELWECVLIFMKNFPQSWDLVQPQKQIFPRIFSFLEHSSYGSGSVTFPSLLPYVNFIPSQIIDENFYYKFLSSLWKGKDSEYMSKNSTLHLKSYSECFLFFLNQNQKLCKFNETLLIEKNFFIIVEYFLSQKNLYLRSSDFSDILSETWAKIISSCNEDSISNLWNKLEKFSFSFLTSSQENIDNICSRLAELTTILHSKLLQNKQQSLILFISKLFHEINSQLYENLINSKVDLLTSLLSSYGSISLGLKEDFFENSLLKLLKKWNNESNSLLTQSIFKFAQVYIIDPAQMSKDISQMWNQTIELAQSSQHLIEILTILYNKLPTDQPNIWKSSLVDSFVVKELQSSKSFSQKFTHVLSLLIGNNQQYSFLSKETLLFLHNYSSETISLGVKKMDLGSLTLILEVLEWTASLFYVCELDSTLLISLLWKIFDLRTFGINFAPLEEEGGEEEYDEPYIKEIIQLRVKSNAIWKTIFPHFKTNPQFYSIGIEHINDQLLGGITPYLIQQIPYLEKQFEDFFFEDDPTVLESFVHSESEWENLITSTEPFLDFNWLESNISPNTSKREKKVLDPIKFSQYLRFVIFAVSYARILGLETFFTISKQLNFILSHFIYSSVIVQCNVHKFLLNDETMSKLWTLFCELISNFYSKLLQNYLVSLSGTTLEQITSILFQWSFKHGRIFSYVFSKILPTLFKDPQSFSKIVEKYLHLDQIDIDSTPSLQTWQAVFSAFPAPIPLSIVSPIHSFCFSEIGKCKLSEKSRKLDVLLEILICSYVEDPASIDQLKNLFKKICTEWNSSKFSFGLQSGVAGFFLNVFWSSFDIESFNVLFQILEHWFKLFGTEGGAESETSLQLFYRTILLFSKILNLHEKSPEKLPSDAVWVPLLKNSYTSLYNKFLSYQNKVELSSSEISFLQELSTIVLKTPIEITKGSQNKLYSFLIFGQSLSIQKSAFQLLCQIISQTKSEELLEYEGRTFDEQSDETVSILPKEFAFIIENSDLGKTKERKSYGYLLAWAILLYISEKNSQVRSDIGFYLRQSRKACEFLNNLFSHIDTKAKETTNLNTPIQECSSLTFASLCSYLYFSILKTFPVVVRIWWSDELDRQTSSLVDKYTTKYISPPLIEHELQNCINYKVDSEEFRLKVSKASKEVTPIYQKDEVTLAISIRIPHSYPLQSVKIEYSQKMGVSENVLRKWLLSMTTLLLTQDGSILDAVLLWKTNLDKHFEGVEVCPICYSLFHVSNHSLPNLACKTCKNKFHSACLYKWIKVSHKNDCPLCKTPFF